MVVVPSLRIVLFDPNPEFPYFIWDWAIRLVSNKTHVGIESADGMIIDANLGGVVKREYCKCKYAHIYEIKNLTQEQVDGAMEWAKIHMGEKYSILTAIRAGIMRKLGISYTSDRIDSGWTCSEFVSGALRYGADIDIYPNVSLQNILPDDILRWLEKKAIYHGSR